MALTASPTNFTNGCTGRLATKISTTTSTGVTVTADIVTSPAGTGAVTWPTGPQVWKISRKTRTTTEVEYVGVETLSQSGTAITTGTINRYLPADGSSLTSQGNGLSFPAGSVVELVWHAYAAEKVAYKDVANTFTGVNTYGTGGAVRFSGTDTSGLRVKSLTTAERDALTPANGDFIYNTTTGVMNQYVAGAWATIGTDATANGSTTVAGKYEEATVAEQGSATATGDTGARLVPAVANLVKTSAGAGDENKIAVLDSAGKFANGFIATSGTADSTTFLRGDRTWQAISSIPSTNFWQPVAMFYADTAGVGASSTSAFDVPTHKYTIPANDIAAGVAYRFSWAGPITWAAGTVNVRVKLGATEIIYLACIPNATTDFFIQGILFGTAAAGASVAVRGSAFFKIASSGTYAGAEHNNYAEASVATNGILDLQISAEFTSSNAGNSFVSSVCIIEKGSTTAF